jgi:STE24 endopeptidase
VLWTEPMAECPLRQRLEEMCREHRVRYRDVLIWKTHHQVGNAVVFGLVPRFRYILLSDLLIESMSDEQIEAVFAHELGHVVHWHLWWLMAAIFGIMLAIWGVGVSLLDWLTPLVNRFELSDATQTAAAIVAGVGLFLLGYGYLSRKFERQADVFAARSLQMRVEDAAAAPVLTMESGPTMALVHTPEAYVGPEGAELFCSALERTAAVNNLPVEARNWSHGSIAGRMDFLSELGRDRSATARFDQFMRRLCLALLGFLAVAAVWATIQSLCSH